MKHQHTMKTIIICACAVLTVNFRLLQASSLSIPNFYEDEVIKINKEIDIIDNRLNLVQPNFEVDILIGATGTGKSTVYKYVQGTPLVGVKKFGIIQIEEKNKTSNREISDVSSCTRYTRLSQNGQIFDCPGFNNTAGPIQDIVSAYSLRKLFEVTTKCRLILVTSEEDVEATHSLPFMDSIRQMGEMFDYKKDIKDYLSLIITRVGVRTIADYRAKFAYIKDNKDYDLSSFQKDILEYLHTPTSKIALFKRPVREGLIKLTDNLVTENLLINGTEYMKKSHVGITITDRTKLHISNIVKSINNDLFNLFNCFYDKRSIYTKNYLRKNQIVASSLREKFNEYADIFDEFNSTNISTHAEKIAITLAAFNLEVSEKFRKLINLFHYVSFISSQDCEVKLLIKSTYMLGM